MRAVLVVGAGFAGAVHARTLAEHGWQVDVIDRRSHIAGNAYDEVSPTGVRVHRYGPHLFHTSSTAVADWIRRFGPFVRYEHRTQVQLPDQRHAPMPINRQTINAVFDMSLSTEDEVRAFLAKQAVPVAAPRNAAEYLHGQIGRTLTDLFFRPYNRKMWGLELEDLDAAIVKRVPLRHDDEDRYFPNDVHQMLPRHGYVAVFANMLDHPGIRISLDTPFDRGMLLGYRHCFNSMAIDEYFDGKFGPLDYRSIRFAHREELLDFACGSAAVVNFTDQRPYTRQTDWSRLPHHAAAMTRKTITLERPCDYRDNNLERYYPVKRSDGRNIATYQRYREHAATELAMTFIGRCGTYQYLDMHQVINQSLASANAWLVQHR